MCVYIYVSLYVGAPSAAFPSPISLPTSNPHPHKPHPPPRSSSDNKDKYAYPSSVDSKSSSSSRPDNKKHKVKQTMNKSSADAKRSSHASSSKKTVAAPSGATSGTGKSKTENRLKRLNGDMKSTSQSRSVSPIPGRSPSTLQRACTPGKVALKSAKTSNFQDLMKMAQKNSDEPVTSRPMEVRTKGLPSSAKGSTPVGKSLVERVHQRAKGHQLPDRPPPTTLSPTTTGRSPNTSNPVAAGGSTAVKKTSGGAARGGAVKHQRSGGTVHGEAPPVRTDLSRRPEKEGGKSTAQPSLARKGQALGTCFV